MADDETSTEAEPEPKPAQENPPIPPRLPLQQTGRGDEDKTQR